MSCHLKTERLFGYEVIRNDLALTVDIPKELGLRLIPCLRRFHQCYQLRTCFLSSSASNLNVLLGYLVRSNELWVKYKATGERPLLISQVPVILPTVKRMRRMLMNGY
jgi:hypothetical protein